MLTPRQLLIIEMAKRDRVIIDDPLIPHMAMKNAGLTEIPDLKEPGRREYNRELAKILKQKFSSERSEARREYE